MNASARRPRATLSRLAAWAIAACCATPVEAHAWDPSRTHVGITERAVAASPVHRQWMDASGGRQGWFTALRVDPDVLDPQTRRALVVAMRVAHPDVGAVAPGGPGACPNQPAPSETLQRCVDGDSWETSALGWLRVGLALAATDRTRLLHHFVDPTDRVSATWTANGRSAATWRRIARRAGGSLAARVGRTGFAGSTQSASGWLQSDADPFGPAALYAHQRAAALAPTAAERDRHRALAMVCAGVLLHVVQDLSLPAHARGDLAGTLVPLSDDRTDRGSPLGEYARLTFGRAMPIAIDINARASEVPAPASLRALLFGDAEREGLATFAGTRFLSDGSMPAPVQIDATLDPVAAAKQWLGTDGGGLSAVEREGAVLEPWPATSGYVRTTAGRALAAWTMDTNGVVRGYLDRRVLREQALRLLPAAVDATGDALSLVWPTWPTTAFDRAADHIEIDPDVALSNAEVFVVVEDAAGQRTVARRIALLPGRSRIRTITPAAIPEGAQVVLVLVGERHDGQHVVIEQALATVDVQLVGPPVDPTTGDPLAGVDPEARPAADPSVPSPADPAADAPADPPADPAAAPPVDPATAAPTPGTPEAKPDAAPAR